MTYLYIIININSYIILNIYMDFLDSIKDLLISWSSNYRKTQVLIQNWYDCETCFVQVCIRYKPVTLGVEVLEKCRQRGSIRR